jgi:hypothetical protein
MMELVEGDVSWEDVEMEVFHSAQPTA